MGLFDSVLGAVINSATQNNAGGSGLGGLMGMAANNPQLVQVVVDLFGQQSPVGGLPGLLTRFQQAGLGDAVASWLGNGPNAALSGEQLGQVLGAGPLAQIATQLGLSQSAAADQLSQLLPGFIDRLTPNGQLPSGIEGVAPELLGMLGELFKPRA